VVILDYTLPVGRGTEIIPDLNQCCPSAKIFLITGDYDNIDEDYQNVTRFIRKPFSLAHFRSIMEEYLVEA
jgi:response regulator of citrate/malate metabolism